jgi:multicomponent Na+:H+ antiporter subunit D
MSGPLLSNLVITWLLLPFAAAFGAALLPSLARWCALLSGITTFVVAAWAWQGGNLVLDLIGPLGVQLRVDGLAAPFLLLHSLVLLAVLVERWRRLPEGPFLVLLPLLLGGLNSAAVALDLVSLYVALEVVGITAFLLILRSRDAAQLWIALRYLLVGNGVMTLYLVGVALLYLQAGSFRISSLAALPAAEPALGVILALLLVGLLTKGGLFLSGLWLPRTHAEAPADVSALLSGSVVAAGLCPLLRLADALPFLQPLLAWLGLASALLGLIYALAESDLKRLLAWSTLSQVGLVLLNPSVGGLVALAHGLAKACLFLAAGHVPSRRLQDWSSRPLPIALALPLLLASLSIAGAPPLLGFWSKQALFTAPLQQLTSLPTLLSIGTAAVYARICWLSVRLSPGVPSLGALLLIVPLLFGPLLLLPVAGVATGPVALTKALAVLAAGAGVEALRQLVSGLRPATAVGLQPGRLRLPDLERLTDLIGSMAVMGSALMLLLLWRRPTLVGLEEAGVAWPG